MGGSAFSPSLFTPRMPPDVYAHVLSEVHRKLRTLYEHVETPVEAPGKVDYGDLDVLVYSPLVSRNLMVSAHRGYRRGRDRSSARRRDMEAR